ncbi:glycosyltransferase [Cerasicoccus arenae]|uniref:Glycosyltransferase n=1 Tax=Cerasicoccus arenae TaxID=424488 RepID=A0A8J3DD48_9BACT|nr:glycosyltransferase [Cerasicoccus arenae]MBK1857048.1 glycosyltransferase [Cerasicoccus arenae]GHB92059.1 hypothetical protein GCM10007047_03820 [Cerasicoccus arenae]
MKILVANIPLPGNRFLVDLHEAMEKNDVTIVHSHETFWNQEGDFNVVHLHFPEYVTHEIEKAYQEGLTEELVEQVAVRLKHWADRSHIVITRHVLLPHDAVKNPVWERMYELFYRYADAVVHFAQASIDEFKSRYANTVFYRGVEPKHVIIPHANYASLPNNISRQAARKQLGISEKAKVMLVFGAIRSMEERDLIMNTFQGAQVGDKILLVSRWREKLAKVSWIRLKYWLRDLTRLYYRLHPSYNFNYSFVQEEDAQLYLNAADVLFIPRLKVLNSGNITLGLTFGKIVVGPDSWDVGELLRETGNPVFDPGHPSTAKQALEKAFELAKTNLGEKNRQRALNEWTPAQCARMYCDIYESVQVNQNTTR